MSHLVRKKPAFTKDEADKIVKDYHKESDKKFAKKEALLDYMENENYLFANGAKPKADNPYYKRHLAAEAPHAPKKQIIKKTLVVKKPKPAPLVPEWDWRLGDWTDILDEDAPAPAPEDIEKVLNIKKKEVAGLEAILNFNKKFA